MSEFRPISGRRLVEYGLDQLIRRNADFRINWRVAEVVVQALIEDPVAPEDRQAAWSGEPTGVLRVQEPEANTYEWDVIKLQQEPPVYGLAGTPDIEMSFVLSSWLHKILAVSRKPHP